MSKLIIICTLNFFLFVNSFDLLSQSCKFPFVRHLVDSIYHTKKTYFYQYGEVFDKIQPSQDFYSVLLTNYKIDSIKWIEIWNTWHFNHADNSLFKKSISIERKDKLLRSKRWKKHKIEILRVTYPIFLTKKDCIIEITRYCRGICSSSTVYFIEIKEDKTPLIKHKFRSRMN